MRQKAKEKEKHDAGLERVIKAKLFHVEEHYDDGGQDLSGLGADISNLATDDWVVTIEEISDEEPFILDEHSVSDPSETYDLQELCV